MEEVGKGSVPPSRTPLDYPKIAAHYNELQLQGALKLEKVYNISLFKARLERRGVKRDIDFIAYNSGDHTYIQRLTAKTMKKD